MKNFCLITRIGFILMACNAKKSYQKTFHFEKGWPQEELVFFEFTPEKAGVYEMEVLLRHQNNYPYYNFYLFKTFYSKDSIRIDTLQFYLQNPETGAYYGKGYNAIFTQTIPLEVMDLEVENYKIQLQHGMRDTILNGILDLGIIIQNKE